MGDWEASAVEPAGGEPVAQGWGAFRRVDPQGALALEARPALPAVALLARLRARLAEPLVGEQPRARRARDGRPPVGVRPRNQRRGAGKRRPAESLPPQANRVWAPERARERQGRRAVPGSPPGPGKKPRPVVGLLPGPKAGQSRGQRAADEPNGQVQESVPTGRFPPVRSAQGAVTLSVAALFLDKPSEE